MLILDEAARVPDDLYRAVRPMLAVSNGRIICISTPRGKRGFFYEAWVKGGVDHDGVLPLERFTIGLRSGEPLSPTRKRGILLGPSLARRAQMSAIQP